MGTGSTSRCAPSSYPSAHRVCLTSGMARARRLHAPGCIVHITARTQGRQPWFTETIRARVADEIVMASKSSAHRVLAYVIMPNHFHLIVRQGPTPLAHLMHRVMHRAAALLRWTHKLEGHVFQRRYWSGVCLDPDYARAAVLYVHLNPCRAGLVIHPAHYEWSSHACYVDTREFSKGNSVCADLGLRLFAVDDAVSNSREQYLQCLDYQMSLDTCTNSGAARPITPPPCCFGDDHWANEYAPAAANFTKPQPAISMYDVAIQLLARLDRSLTLDVVRSGTRVPRVSTIRKQLIAALIVRGFRGTAIARFFGISETAVSRVAVSLRT